MSWERFDNRLVISALVVAESALRVGAGTESASPAASDLPVIRNHRDIPFIPGSSLRGVLRSHIERLMRTMEPREGEKCFGRGACNPNSKSDLCIKPDTVKNWREELRRTEGGGGEMAGRILAQSCRVCRVFGSPLLASRVRIADLPVAGGFTPQIRDGVAIDREKETVANKYDFEVLSPGTSFKMEIAAENLASHERGLLLWGLRELACGNIPLGGFKSRGLGWVKLEGLAIRFIDASDKQSLKDFLLFGKMTEIPEGEQENWLGALWKDMSGEVGQVAR